MLQRPPSTKLGRWQKAQDVTTGQYFKYRGRWWLALRPAIATTGELAKNYSWAIQSMSCEGRDEWVPIWRTDEPEQVEVYAEGKRPGPFTPATLRRKARAHEETASRERYAAHLKEVLARRIENGTLAP